MSDKNLGDKLTHLATSAVLTPVGQAARVAGFAKGAAKGATSAVGGLLHRGHGSDEETSDEREPEGVVVERADEEDETEDAPVAEDVPTEGGDLDAPAAPVEVHEVQGSAEPVEMLPYPQLEEPVQIVEEVLAHEGEPQIGHVGHATEPHASTRDEDHGDAQLQRAELEEIAEEVAEAISPGSDLDLETPVGTTGADVAFNPDTAEADLQQPGTPGIVEPGLTKTVVKDEKRGGQAAKGTKNR